MEINLLELEYWKWNIWIWNIGNGILEMEYWKWSVWKQIRYGIFGNRKHVDVEYVEILRLGIYGNGIYLLNGRQKYGNGIFGYG